ncbi:MAG: AraC family transcriptional regulator [Clostridia bacterium]|nr:AraC family transcriptional regulator [Clostridia bacterium]
MKYEVHHLDNTKLPFIFRHDTMHAGEKDFTHWHENIEILYFEEGRGRVTSDYTVSETAPGDLFVVNSERLHMVESADEKQPVHYYCLIVDMDFCLANGLPVSSLTFKSKISGDEALCARFRELIAAYSQKSEFKEASIRVAALSLLVALCDRHLAGEEESDDKDREHLQNVKDAIKYIKEHFEERITVDEIARSAGLSTAYFSRIFKAVTGYTVVTYINLIRCRHAEKLLKSGKFKVGEIASACGFENKSYFARTYKRLMGALPSDAAEK